MLALNTNSNGYTIFFAIASTLLVAVLLSGLSSGLKERQEAQVVLDTKFNILNSVTSADKENAEVMYTEKIQEVIIDGNGKKVDGNALDIVLSLKKELDKDNKADQRFPLFIYTEGAKKQYVIPLFGAGLWDAIGGYVALEDDYNTIAGTVFTHVGETPGLGAEISKDWFQDQFKGEKLMNGSDFKSVAVLKGKNNKEAKDSKHAVDGISGATITGDGVDAMLKRCLANYLSYFKNA